MQQIYDPSYLTTNYRTIGTDIYRVDPASGSIFKTFVDFSESFETAPSIKTLIKDHAAWLHKVCRSKTKPINEQIFV